MVAVPLVGLILVAVCITATGAHPADLAPVQDPPAPMTFGIALSALVVANMLTVAAMPDLSRFIRSEWGAIGGLLLSFPLAVHLLMLISALIALATGPRSDDSTSELQSLMPTSYAVF